MSLNEYSSPVQNTLEQYVPLPLEMMYKAASAIQARGDIAQNQSDQVQTGLSSMEALAPGHKDFVNKFTSDFRTQQSTLLDKYQGNTSDPQYEQESRKLNMQFAADPRLQTIKQANELYKKKENIKDELNAKGIKYIDSNPNFTGTDSSGNLTSNVGGVHATNFDTNINQAFKDKEQAIEQVGNTLTNRRNLGKVYSSYADANGNLNTNNSDIQQGLSYYKQQGMNDTQAKAAVLNHVNAGLGYAHDLKDHFYEISPYQQAELDLEKQKEADKAKAGQAGPPPFQLLDFGKPIVSTPGGNPDQPTSDDTPRSKLANQIDATLKGLQGNNLSNHQKEIDATDEALSKYSNDIKSGRAQVVNHKMNIATGGVDISGMPGMDANKVSKIVTPAQYDPAEVELLNTARKVLGVTGGNAKAVLTKYKDLVSSFDATSQKVTSTDNKKLNDVMADVARRQISTGEVYKLKDGQLVKVTDPNELDALRTSSNTDEKNNEIKNMQIAGISSKNLGPLNGYTQFSNKGTNYYTAIPDQYQQHFAGSKSVENYIQDFDTKNMQEVPYTDGQGKQRKILINPNDTGHPYEYQGRQGILTPYKANQDGKLVGGGLFQYRDKDGSIKTAPIPMSELEREEKTSLFTQITNDNKIKGD